MSLLDRTTDAVTVYMEEAVTDADGNTRTRPASTGVATTARIQVQGQSGTSARRAEQDNEGYESEKVYTIRFNRAFTDTYGTIGAQSQVVWNGQRYAIFGDANVYNSSRRTAHVTYTMKRF